MTTGHANLTGMTPDRDDLPVLPDWDALPWSDGEPMESERHRRQMDLLVDTLADRWADRQDFYVGGNMFVYFSELHQKSFRGPDVFVVLDTVRKSRKKWVAWLEGGQLPDVVIELLSDSTRDVDRGEKMRIYERVWKVHTYVLYDPFSHELEAYALAPGGRFERLAPDARGDLPVHPLGLSVGLRPRGLHEEPGPFLRWIEDGEPLPTGRELADHVAGQLARAEAQRAEAEAQRAEAEAQRAEAEAERERLARRVAELEEEHGRR